MHKLDKAKRGIPSQGGKVDLDLWFKQYLFDSSMIILSTTLMNAGFDNKIWNLI